jgi:hypothetical protein
LIRGAQRDSIASSNEIEVLRAKWWRTTAEVPVFIVINASGMTRGRTAGLWQGLVLFRGTEINPISA